MSRRSLVAVCVAALGLMPLGCGDGSDAEEAKATTAANGLKYFDRQVGSGRSQQLDGRTCDLRERAELVLDRRRGLPQERSKLAQRGAQPAGERAQAEVRPIYETVEGWGDSTAGARSWGELPAQAIKYVRRIEELVGCPVALLSTSPEREDTILMTDPFRD